MASNSKRPGTFYNQDFPYHVEAKIGEGAMGLVYRAVEPDLQRQVAIKIMSKAMTKGLPRDASQQLNLRFLQEARAAAALSHPSITTIYRVGEFRNQPYISMEWLDGQDLEALLQQRSQLPIPQVLGWGVELLGALEEAHRAGIIHRDIKPSNIMILQDSRLKVMDFGIAHIQNESLVKTQAGSIVGTPQYSSPEQLTGDAIDNRSDIFSTGILLYVTLTGQLPFEGKTYLDLAQRVLTTEPIPPSQLRSAIPTTLEMVILKALRKNPEERFQSAAEMASALRRVGDTATSHDMPSVISNDTALSHSPLNTSPQMLPTSIELSEDKFEALAQVIDEWFSRALPSQPTEQVIDQLLEKPLHAPPYAGGVRIANTYLLILVGLTTAAFDPCAGIGGDVAIDRLPAQSDTVTLYPLPEALDEAMIPLLSSLVNPRQTLHKNLDSTIVNIPALAQKIVDDAFTGIIRLEHGKAYCNIIVRDGQSCLALISQTWGTPPLDQSWPQWLQGRQVHVSVDQPSVEIPHLCYRRGLADYALEVSFTDNSARSQPSPSASSLHALSSPQLDAALSGQSSGVSKAMTMQPVLVPAQSEPRKNLGQIMGGAPLLNFLSWMLIGLPQFLIERKRVAPWKYLATWVPLIRNARLHHSLPRPRSSETDFFDLVTSDADGKVLHLVHRVPVGTPDNFRAFVDRVIAAKTARIKTGDVGGACFIARRFEGDMLTAYREATRSGEKNKSRKWLFGLQKSLTGYEGFVRIGSRRGFHLLLVVEQEDGTYLPLLPDVDD